MSDFNLVGDFEQFTLSEEYKNEQDAKFYKWIKILVAILVSIFVAEFIFLKVIQPTLSSPKIVITGNENYTNEYILNILADFKNQNWFAFDSAKVASNLSSVSGIESVSIKKSFPDKVLISLTERQSVAMAFINKEGHTIPIQIDKNGVLFENINNKINEDGSIPIISGLPVEHLSNGMRIPAKYRVLIDQIAEIQSLEKKHFAGVSEICVVPKTYGNYELVLIPSNSKVRVLISRFLSVEVLDCMLVVLDVVNSVEQDVSEIDLRYNSVSYKIANNNNVEVGGEDFD